jgi:tight adherence protein C|uniref:Type II secretion system F family protein n=1 Tax=Desulfobacca acetoxidans TaxID=60893 RepID=A0A7C3SHK4_9BACT
MKSLVLLILAATFVSVCLLTYGLVVFLNSRRSIRERFTKRKKEEDPLLKLRRADKKSQLKNRIIAYISSFGKFAVKDEKEDLSEFTNLRMTLVRAGFRHSSSPAVYFGLRVLLALGFPAIFMAYVLLFKHGADSFSLMSALVLSALGYYSPVYGLRFIAKRRMDRIDRALPDVLDLLIVSMEAGLSLQASLNRVALECERLSKELSRELQITNAELRAGIPRDTALKNFADRTGVQSVKSLVALMIQSEKMGASISQSLRTHASFSRVQRAQKAEEIAAKMPVKIVFPTLFCIFPALFIVILGPAGISIYRNLLKS